MLSFSQICRFLPTILFSNQQLRNCRDNCKPNCLKENYPSRVHLHFIHPNKPNLFRTLKDVCLYHANVIEYIVIILSAN
jgi:hypothetical protein